jgi:hypothetical protein
MTQDDKVREALFELKGPDEDGCVWACSPEGQDTWCQNLGPTEKVAEVLARWLNSIVERHEEPDSVMGFSLDEVKKQLAKHQRKAARPQDHRDEGGEA